MIASSIFNVVKHKCIAAMMKFYPKFLINAETLWQQALEIPFSHFTSQQKNLQTIISTSHIFARFNHTTLTKLNWRDSPLKSMCKGVILALEASRQCSDGFLKFRKFYLKLAFFHRLPFKVCVFTGWGIARALLKMRPFNLR